MDHRRFDARRPHAPAGQHVFLWAFGLVVEGKIGSLRFVALYLAIAALDGALVQLPMCLLGSDSCALGASGVIFALMVIAMLWAPEDEMDCFYFVGFYMGTFEIRIVKIGIAFVMLPLVFLFLGGFRMSFEMLDMVGAMIGLPIGLYMLRHNHVDCEDWDVISRNEWLHGYPLLCSPEQRQTFQQNEADDYDPVATALTSGKPRRATVNLAAGVGTMKPPMPEPAPNSPPPKRGFFAGKKAVTRGAEVEPDTTSHPEFNRIAFLLLQDTASNSPGLAQQHFLRLEQMQLTHGRSDRILMDYVKLLAAGKKWTDILRPLSIVAARGGELANQARIRPAQIQLKVLHDPQAASQTLGEVVVAASSTTPEDQRLIALRDQLLAQASG